MYHASFTHDGKIVLTYQGGLFNVESGTLEEISRLDGVSVGRTEVVSAPRSLADVVFGRQLIKLIFFDDTGCLVDGPSVGPVKSTLTD